MNRAIRSGGRRGRGGGRALTVLLFLPAMAACETLLDVSNPSSVQAEDLTNPALSATLVNSALGRFECAYDSYVVSSGLVASEFWNTSTWLNMNPWGWRGLELNEIVGSCPGNARTATGLGAYLPLQEARYLAEEATRIIEGHSTSEVPNKDLMLAQLATYAGYARLLLGEGYCEMAMDQGPRMTRQEVFASAEERFTSAIALAQSVNNANLRNLATVGRARARLNQGNLSGAASDAEQIPAGFRWNAEYSTADASRENRIFHLNRSNRYLGGNPNDYGNLQLDDGTPDPRVPLTDSGLSGHDGLSRHWFQNKYNAGSAPIRLGSWAEAQLIIAEARPGEAAAALNRLRASQELPAYTGTGSLADVIEERRRELWAEGHRLNDMLRHEIPFPSGVNHKGQNYGPITCMPLPEQERRANPNLN